MHHRQLVKNCLALPNRCAPYSERILHHRSTPFPDLISRTRPDADASISLFSDARPLNTRPRNNLRIAIDRLHVVDAKQELPLASYFPVQNGYSKERFKAR